MVYKNNYFKKELNGAFTDSKVSFKKMLFYALFVGIIAFIIHLVLQTLYNTVVTELFPYLMDKSHFAVGFLYTFFALIFFVVYFIHYHQYFTFSEIYQNRWYPLVKNGFKPLRMIGAKIAARMLFVGIVYSCGFILAEVAPVLLPDYDFNILSTISLYFAGLIDVLFVVLCIMTLSLYTDKSNFLRLCTAFLLVIIYALKFATNYIGIHGNKILMENMFNLIKTPYFIITIIAAIGVTILCILKAREIANYYSPSPIKNSNIITKDFKTNTFSVRYKKKSTGNKIVKVVTNTVMGIFIVVCVLFNVLMLIITLSNNTAKLLFGNKIPVVYQYDYMKETIQKNDIALFNPIDQSYEIKDGDIIIYVTKDGGNNVMQIVDCSDLSKIEVKYKNVTLVEKVYIKRSQVVGIHEKNNRGLGAFLVFTSSLAGRIILLVIPVIWLFFGDYFIGRITKGKKSKLYVDKTTSGIDKDSIDITNLIDVTGDINAKNINETQEKLP